MAEKTETGTVSLVKVECFGAYKTQFIAPVDATVSTVRQINGYTTIRVGCRFAEAHQGTVVCGGLTLSEKRLCIHKHPVG